MLSKSLYNEAWERVCREQVDLVPVAFCNYKVAIDDAMVIAKATTHADGKQFIGRRLAGEWEEGRYILFQGKYGTIVVCWNCLLYTSPSPRDLSTSRMPSSA